MTPLAKQTEPDSGCFQLIGTVIETDRGGLLIRAESGVFRARRALACLIEPEIKDRVLLVGSSEDQVFVLSVLDRPGDSAVRLAVPGDLTVGLQNGCFNVVATQGVNLVSAKDMKLTAGEFSVHARRGRVFFDQLTYLGKWVLAEVERIKVLGGLFDTVMERIALKTKRCYRVIEEYDHVRSGHIDYRATENVDLRGKNTLVTAKELVKVDGDQIHLG